MHKRNMNRPALRVGEQQRKSSAEIRCKLELYVAGPSEKSQKAITDLLMLCEKYMKDHYTLKIYDVYKETKKSIMDSIKATPTLLIQYPLPQKRVVGEMKKIESELIKIINKAPKN